MIDFIEAELLTASFQSGALEREFTSYTLAPKLCLGAVSGEALLHNLSNEK